MTGTPIVYLVDVRAPTSASAVAHRTPSAEDRPQDPLAAARILCLRHGPHLVHDHRLWRAVLARPGLWLGLSTR